MNRDLQEGNDILKRLRLSDIWRKMMPLGTVGSWQLAVGSGQWAVGNDQLTISNKQLEVGSGQ